MIEVLLTIIFLMAIAIIYCIIYYKTRLHAQQTYNELLLTWLEEAEKDRDKWRAAYEASRKLLPTKKDVELMAKCDFQVNSEITMMVGHTKRTGFLSCNGFANQIQEIEHEDLS